MFEESGSPVFPVPKHDDDDDVAWALSTAAVQWKRGSRADAIVWLRRAAESAMSVGAVFRAAELTRQTDAVGEYVVATSSLGGPPTYADFDETDPLAVGEFAEGSFGVPDDVTEQSSLEDEIRDSAVEVDDSDILEADVVEDDEDDEDETEIIDADVIEDDEEAELIEAEVLDDDVLEEHTVEEHVVEEHVVEGHVVEEHVVEGPTIESALVDDDEEIGDDDLGDLAPRSAAEAGAPYSSEPVPSTISEPSLSAAPDTVDDLVASGAADELEPTPATHSVAAPAAAAVTAEAAATAGEVRGVALAEIRGFEDFPPETQSDLARSAQVAELGVDEEVSSFGLALVLRGAVSVMPAIADVACGHAAERELVFAQGTLSEGVALRLVASEPGTEVAIWDLATIEPPLADCPWVLDELRNVADRYQALAGVSMGPMGERLDDSIRELVLSRCNLTRLAPGEVLVERGKPVPGLCIVGAGAIELVSEDGSIETRQPGDFVFAEQVLSAARAPSQARAGRAGCLLMATDRRVAHELIVSVPPLLEIVAG